MNKLPDGVHARLNHDDLCQLTGNHECWRTRQFNSTQRHCQIGKIDVTDVDAAFSLAMLSYTLPGLTIEKEQRR